jgi:hypothetical protein
MTASTKSIRPKPSIPLPNFLLHILIYADTNNAHNERKSPIGWTRLNLFHWLSECSDLTPNHDAVVVQIKLSPNKRNIHKGTRERVNEKKRMSARIFLFSLLLIFLRKTITAIKMPSRMPAKLNLYP